MPRVSVLVPAFQASSTFRQALHAIQSQSYTDYELIVIETGSACGIAEWLAENWPQATYLYQEKPLLPHAALNQAIRQSVGELLAFTDIDAYPQRNWLRELVNAHDRSGAATVGAVACFGGKWIDQGAHLTKFDKWLINLPAKQLTEGPTVNFLVSRELYDRVGSYREDSIHADTDFCWKLRDQGHRIRFTPAAIVRHHHLHTWVSLIRERFDRGASFPQIWIEQNNPEVWQLVLKATIGILPLRLITQLRRIYSHSKQAGMGWSFILTLPVVISGLYAWLLAESLTYLRLIWLESRHA